MPSAMPAWTLDSVRRIYRQPLLALLEQAHDVHRQWHPRAEVQLCHLLSIKTGGCPEDCAYCPQSARYQTGVAAERLLEREAVVAEAARARAAGATRFCMGAAWRQVKDGPEFDRVLEMVAGVRALGLEVCCTLGMLTQPQAERLAAAGLTAYNHNLDTSPEFYGEIITTRTYQDRLDTLARVRKAGISVCCGGILGMGESEDDRLRLLATLANQQPQPESVPINALVAVEGTPLAGRAPVSGFEFVRAIASARVLMPQAKVRLSAGRLTLSPEAQALCFYAGANSIFMGDKLLTTPNPEWTDDRALLDTLGLAPEPPGAGASHFTARTTGAGPGCGDGRDTSDLVGAEMLERELAEELDGLAARARRREIRAGVGEDFCSNDYLGLSDHPGVRAALERALGEGVALGATGSRLVRGEHAAVSRLEHTFADLCGTESALLLGSGYSANLAVLGALVRPGDMVFSDRANHASLIDGLRLTSAERHIVPHRDTEALAEELRRHPAAPGQRRFVVVESVYSMEGDRAPLAALAELCERAGALLIVDEAHATGLIGPRAAGGVDEVRGRGGRRPAAVVATIHPGGKALGAAGALVACSRRVRDTIVNRGRTLIFSTAPQPLLAVQLEAALAAMAAEPERRERVLGLARRLRAGLRARAPQWRVAGDDDGVAIVPLIVGADAAALAAAAGLAAAGFDVRAIRPPTVPEGTARLRITVHATQSAAAVDRLIEAVAALHPPAVPAQGRAEACAAAG